MSGVEGGRPSSFSGGFKGGILFEKRIPPLVPRRARRSPFAPVRKSGQAIEAKEGVSVASENKTLATITFQNFFRLYAKLSGMTGTAMTEEEEFSAIYKLDIVEIPTNRPVIRVDHNDVVYKTEAGKFRAVIQQIKDCHAARH